MATPKKVTRATLELIKAARIPADANDATELIARTGNFRPLQPRGPRTVYYSRAAQPIPCTTLQEPVFDCLASDAV